MGLWVYKSFLEVKEIAANYKASADYISGGFGVVELEGLEPWRVIVTKTDGCDWGRSGGLRTGHFKLFF